MEVETERQGDTLIAKTDGRVDGANAREFQTALDAAIDDNECAVVLDMERPIIHQQCRPAGDSVDGQSIARSEQEICDLCAFRIDTGGLRDQRFRQDHLHSRFSE